MPEEVREISTKRPRRPIQKINRRVFDRSLKAADIAAVHFCVSGERLLGKLAFNPKPPQIPGDPFRPS